jgi:predicted XRE-type DNA-binding protein
MDAKDIVQTLIDRGHTQTQIAAHCGIQQSTISKLRHGAIADVSSTTYRAMLVMLKKRSHKTKAA